jgi:two-component system, LytTR family, sensor kinase
MRGGQQSHVEVDSSQRVAGIRARAYLRRMEAARDTSAIGRASVGARTPAKGEPSSLMFWLVFLAGWTALALLATTQTALVLSERGQPIEWGRLIAWRAIDWYSCALFVPLLRWIVRRAPLERGTWPRRLPMYLAATAAATLAKYAFLVQVQRPILGAARSQPLATVLAGNAISELMIYWAVIGVLHAVEFYQRYREREALTLELRAQLSQSQLDVLRAQLHPHFLFNVLNAATALIHRDPDAADAMLTRLGDLLRHALRSDPRHETPLREELELLDRYLDIMRTRFGDRLTIRRSVPSALECALVPTFVLQPLVENALEHGMDRVEGSGCVEIGAAREGNHLILAVRDNGAGDRADTRAGLGIGLTNTRARLAALYGDAAELALRPRTGGGTEVVLRLPFRSLATA